MHTQDKWAYVARINDYMIYDLNQSRSSPVAIGMTKETATLIVQMNNSFPALLEACKRTQTILESFSTSSTDSAVIDISKRVLDDINQAIAQAEKPE